jgi:dTDP-D-glucose 4,6-dehydratase
MTKKVLGWEPKVSLEEGLAKTYEWIEEQVEKDRIEDAQQVRLTMANRMQDIGC